jgi:hypothetical protein
MEIPATCIPADATIPKANAFYAEDLALPLPSQEEIAAMDPEFRLYKLDSGHSPFASRPKECAKLLVRIVEE